MFTKGDLFRCLLLAALCASPDWTSFGSLSPSSVATDRLSREQCSVKVLGELRLYLIPIRPCFPMEEPSATDPVTLKESGKTMEGREGSGDNLSSEGGAYLLAPT